MRLVRLRLRNIRSYEEALVTFPDGITLFEGDIGSGKSTILLAIEFALFGLGDTGSAHLLRHGASEGEVELEIEVGGRAVRALRTLKVRRTRATQDRCVLEVDGEEEELAPADMKPRVLELLGYDENPDPKAKSDIFRYGFYTPQEEMRSILDTRKAMREQRKETLRRALGVRDYKQARDNLDVVVAETRSRVARLEGRTASIEGLRARARAAREDLEALRRELEARGPELVAAAEREGQATDRVNGLEGREALLRRTQADVDGLQTRTAGARGRLDLANTRLATVREAALRLEAVEERLRTTRGTDEELSTLEGLAISVRELSTIHERALGETASLRGEIERAERAAEEAAGIREAIGELGDTTGAIKELEAALEGKDRELASLRAAIARTEGELEQLKVEEEGLSDLDGEATCPRCHQALTPEHLGELRADYRTRRNQLTSETRRTSSIVNRTAEERGSIVKGLEAGRARDRERAALERSLERAVAEASRLDALRGTLEAHEGVRVVEELEKAREDLDEERLLALRALRTERAGLEVQARDLGRAVADLPGLEEEAREAEQTLSDLRTDLEARRVELEALEGEGIAGALKAARDQRDGAVRALEGLRARVAALEARVERDGASADRLVEELAEVERLHGELEAHRHLLDWFIRCLRPALEGIERAVLAMMGEEMDAAARRWFDLLVEDPELELAVDEDFVPGVVQQGWDVDVTALSGGERTAVAFAYRLALNGLVRRVATPGQRNLLLLDEPTDGFSKEQLMRMGNVLRELGADQVVMVSHDQELEAFADRVYVVRRGDGTSRIEEAL